MRTFSPCWNVLTVVTGVPKSTTSRRRRRLSGSAVLMNSTMTFWPCWRMSMPVLVSERSTTTRPSPERPRRKSMSRMACLASALPSAKCATCPPGAVCATAGSARLITSALPSRLVSCATGRRRFSTSRVRSLPCTTFMLRSSPWAMSWLARPSALTVFGKSRSEEHTSELQSHSDLHSFPTRRSSDLQPGSVAALHHVHAAQLALGDVLAGAAERVDGIREVEGDARGSGDREVRRHVAQRLLGGDAHDRLARLLRHLERLDAIRLGEGKPDAGKPQGKPVNGLHCLCVHRLASTSCSALVRSTHSPPLSWTSSFRLIAPSSMAVTTPKFWPM